MPCTRYSFRILNVEKGTSSEIVQWTTTTTPQSTFWGGHENLCYRNGNGHLSALYDIARMIVHKQGDIQMSYSWAQICYFERLEDNILDLWTGTNCDDGVFAEAPCLNCTAPAEMFSKEAFLNASEPLSGAGFSCLTPGFLRTSSPILSITVLLGICPCRLRGGRCLLSPKLWGGWSEVFVRICRLLSLLSNGLSIIWLTNNIQAREAEAEPQPVKRAQRRQWTHSSNWGWYKLKPNLTLFKC